MSDDQLHLITELETPSLILDRGILRANLRRMNERLESFGVALRPHMKTAKSADVAFEALGGTSGPITVSTLREADQFATAGFKDIHYAVGVAPAKLPHVARLIRQGIRMGVTVDSLDAARAVAGAGPSLGVIFETMIEIDADGHRAGVLAVAEELLEIAAILDGGTGALLRGVMVHAGGSYGCDGIEALRAHAEKERIAAVTAAERLRAAGFGCPEVSVGSTPTVTFATRFDGVTEVRVGVYMFHDLVMAGLGVCDVSDIAISVLCTVIGHQADKGWVLVDAGWMAMSRDRGTAQQKIDYGYGAVCDLDGKWLPELHVSGANQEHGIISAMSGLPIDIARFPIGSQLRILPNHACATAAQFDRYHVVNGGLTEIATWPRWGGW